MLASLLVLPQATFIVGWLNASVTMFGPITNLFLIPTVVGFVSLLGVGGVRLLRERWVFRRMAWGAAFGAVGGIALTWANAWIDQQALSFFAILQIALYMVIVAMMAVVFAPQTAAPLPASATLDELYGALANTPLPEIKDDPLPENRDGQA
ncbi:MAG: hypothetical protein OJF49_003168 [Ktedonobacterales bacterium]|nr:MAG: hypothetical protein OJF49_003168 [Ktedonobacterales bacterium]